MIYGWCHGGESALGKTLPSFSFFSFSWDQAAAALRFAGGRRSFLVAGPCLYFIVQTVGAGRTCTRQSQVHGRPSVAMQGSITKSGLPQAMFVCCLL